MARLGEGDSNRSVIPKVDFDPKVADPLPGCRWPRTDEISEEGFGFFRGTWFLGRVRVDEVSAILLEEAKFIAFLDLVCGSPEEFEVLATSLEEGSFEAVPEPLRQRARATAGSYDIEESEDPPLELDGLEIGVAGLTHALSAVGCLTAASCRSHCTERTWSDCPVVFFAAPDWRVKVLAKFVKDAGCGLDADRDMLKVYAASVRQMNRLGQMLFDQRAAFRGANPGATRSRRRKTSGTEQLAFPETGEGNVED